MARQLLMDATIQWPLETDKQPAKVPLSVALTYTSEMSVEKVYAAPVADEAVALPMASAAFLLVRAVDNDIDVKLNASANAITVEADGGFIMIWNPSGTVTAMTVTIVTSPATLKVLAFA